MSRRGTALAVPLIITCINACGGSAIIERSAARRPAWVETTPAARDSLYFVGVCSELPSYQEALRCARVEALTDVATWVGARFSSYVYGAQTEAARSGGATAYFDSDFFLADARRSDTYHEIRQEDWGRSYYVSVLYAYSRREADSEKARIEATTAEAERLTDGASLAVSLPLEQGHWGDAMLMFIDIVEQVAAPRNLQRAAHVERLAGVAEELIAPLGLSAWAVVIDPETGTLVEAEATFRGAAAEGVPLHCLFDGEESAAKTEDDGRAVCQFSAPTPGSRVRVTVRPDITGYLDALPDEASGLADEIGGLLDRAVTFDVGKPLAVELSLSGVGDGCEPAIDILERALDDAGVQASEPGKGVAALEVGCEVALGARFGELYVATARGSVSLKSSAGRITEELEPIRGLGATREAARAEALEVLGRELAAAVLKLLRENDGNEEK
ncbi:MAG TPA: hypothetical protein VLC48_10555 [Gemmatimonadota bacterium]|nr:hypothetical protein [Gemmatimonadota bacterium]